MDISNIFLHVFVLLVLKKLSCVFHAGSVRGRHSSAATDLTVSVLDVTACGSPVYEIIFFVCYCFNS